MPRFAYQTRELSGRSDSGVLVAPDASEAMRQLRHEGRVVLTLKEELASALPPAGPQKIRKEDIIFMANQLAVMVDTGVPLTDALDAISAQTDHSGLKKMVESIAAQVRSGVEFSKALEEHPKHFSRLFVAMMRASEASGTMGLMLTRVSEYMSSERDTIKRIKGAMVYPICMLTFCAIVVLALLIFVLPKFEKIYASKGAALPMPTKILLGMSHGVCDYWPFLLAGLAAAGTGAWAFLRSPDGKIFMDGLRINLPIVGPMYRKAYMSRSLRTLATMISTGVSVLEGLHITAEVAGNYYFEKIWKELAERIKEGAGMADELFKVPLIPRTVSQMISAGERTGKLGMVMNRVADFCEDDLKLAVKTITTMVEPMMIIIMGLLIGGIAMALLLPVFSIAKVVAH